MPELNEEVAHALVAFVDASKVHAMGLFLRDTKIQGNGCDGIRKATKIIEKHTGNLDLLMPLLEHSDPGVRLNASLQLIDDHYDLVLPVLHNLDETCVTEAASSAAMILQMYGEPNTGSGFKKPVFVGRRPQPRFQRTK